MLKNKFSSILIAMLVAGSVIPSVANAESTDSEQAKTTEVIEEDAGTDQIIEPVSLNEQQKEEMKELGFTDDDIDSMSIEEYNKYKNLDGKLTSSEENYYEVTADKDGNVTDIEEITESEAVNQAQQQEKPVFSTMAAKSQSSTKTTGLLKMTLTSSKLSNGNTLLKNSFTWIKSPEFALTDVVGITHSASAVKVPGTDGFSYKYTDGVGTHSLKVSSTTNSATGIAKKFNLKKGGSNKPPYNHHGYISIQVKKGNKNDVRANAYGHYTHVTVGLTGSITIKTGSISVGGNLSKKEMTPPMILFYY